MDDISHFDLCKITAEWAVKKAEVALFDYQSYSTGEFPDVLVFNGFHTDLYEIKVSRQDFLSDHKKDCRKKLKIDLGKLDYDWFTQIRRVNRRNWDSKDPLDPAHDYELYNKKVSSVDILEYIRDRFPHVVRVVEKECSHLGRFRYYVCPWGLIDKTEVRDWGLYWYKKGKFYKQKDSMPFKRSMGDELNILSHALRKERNVGNDRLIVSPY